MGVTLLCVAILISIGNSKFIEQGFARSHIQKDETNLDLSNIDMQDNEAYGEIFETAKLHYRYKTQQMYKSIPIFGASLVIEEDPHDLSNKIPIFGKWYDKHHIEKVITSVYPKLNENEVLNIALHELHIELNDLYGDIISKLYIYFDNNKPYLSYILKFAYVAPNQSTGMHQSTIIMNANSGYIFKKYDQMYNIINACGDSGNYKTGLHHYCQDKPALIINDNINPVLANDVIEVYDYHNASIEDIVYERANFTSITCSLSSSTTCNIDDILTNGAYCPSCDAFAFGNIVFDLFSAWTNSTYPIKEEFIPMKFYTHINFANAGFSTITGEMFFGNGDAEWYPLVVLDIVAHEMAHGFTDKSSDLAYYGESGGMNEAFSDIAGEAAEYWLNGHNDWKVGADVYKNDEALRYMYDPRNDNQSIDHYSDFDINLDVHYSSGLYNKAAHLLNANYNWNMEQIFKVFARANLYYWTADSTFNEGVCGLYESLNDIYNDGNHDINLMSQDLAAAFLTVGLECIITAPTPQPTYHPTTQASIVNRPVEGVLKCGDTISGATTSDYDVNDYVFILDNVNDGAWDVEFNSCGSSLDTYLYFYDQNFTLIDSCDDCGDCGHQTILSIGSITSGTYALGIGGYSSDYGSYKMQITCKHICATDPYLTYCDNIDIYPGYELTSTVNITDNIYRYSDVDFDIIFTPRGRACDNPSISFEYEQIDIGFTDYINVYNNEGIVLSQCQGNGGGDVQCGVWWTCISNYSLGITQIDMDTSYQIKLRISSYTYPYCELSINARVHLTCDGTVSPTFIPTNNPTSLPTYIPTYKPTYYPTSEPTYNPTNKPTDKPTNYPTSDPTNKHSTDLCDFDACYDVNITETKTTTHIININNIDDSIFEISYKIKDYDCFNPMLSFESETNSIDSSIDYILLYGNDTLIENCNLQKNKCGKITQCMENVQLDIDAIYIGQTYKIKIIKSQISDVVSVCQNVYDQTYSISAYVTLKCKQSKSNQLKQSSTFIMSSGIAIVVVICSVSITLFCICFTFFAIIRKYKSKSKDDINNKKEIPKHIENALEISHNTGEMELNDNTTTNNKNMIELEIAI